MVVMPRRRRNVPQYISRVGERRPSQARGRVCRLLRARGSCRSYSPLDPPVAETRSCRRVACKDPRTGATPFEMCARVAVCRERRAACCGSAIRRSRAEERSVAQATSEVATTRGTLGTYTLYAAGEVRLRPRFISTQARGSMRALEYATRGVTANARHPKGRIDMTRGFVPVNAS
eukprot:1827046-Pleurochrysis_carterae.AAC.3